MRCSDFSGDPFCTQGNDSTRNRSRDKLAIWLRPEGESNPYEGTAIHPPEWSLYPGGFTAARFVEVVHAASVWEKVRVEP